MASFSNLDALSTLSASVPDWNSRLDLLNSTIALRQIELAKLMGSERPTPSIKNKGSTESLRPRDGDATHDEDNPFDTPPKSNHDDAQRKISADARAAAVVTPPLSGPPRASPIELSRKLSLSTPPTQARQGMRKRKTESLLSAGSQVPQYRTRSMIIVYYDSEVQSAFEDLVKYISANRNSMRKGKMAAKMAAMKRAAELEAEDDDEDDEEDDALPTPIFTNARSPLNPSRLGGLQSRQEQPLPPVSAAIIEADQNPTTSNDLPPLKFVSTRNMGPPRAYGTAAGGRLSAGMMGRASRIGGSNEANDIFDILDNGLEWCQGQCERAAHQFLRDGDCSTEIEGIKQRLLSVKARADSEVDKLQKEQAANPQPLPKKEIKSRELRTPMMRKATLEDAVKQGDFVDKRVGLRGKKTAEGEQTTTIEVDKKASDMMEIDEDEGVEEDFEMPPKLMFRRTRDMVR